MEPNQLFWRQLDPLYHLRHALIIHFGTLSFSGPNGVISGLDGSDLITELEESDRKARNVTLRFLRYQASDTFLSIVLGSPPHGPIPRFVEKTRNDKMNGLIECLAKKTIHQALPIAGADSFASWVTCKFWGTFAKSEKEKIPEELLEFIAFQAAFFSERSAYNAFKHGCRFGYTESAKVEFKPSADSAEFLTLFKLQSAVAWLKWAEKRKSGSGPHIQIGVVECDPEDDLTSIFLMAMLVRAMRSFQIRNPKDRSTVEMPKNMRYKKQLPQRFTLTLSL